VTEPDSLPLRVNTIDILIEGGAWDERHHGGIITETAQACAHFPDILGPQRIDLSVLLTNDETVAGLNTRWRGRAGATNVLSFPGIAPAQPGMPRLLGDLVFAWETIEREAADQSKTVDDHFRHLVVHGFLHLCGFDHQTDADAEAMEALEREILALFDVEDPYREDRQARSAPSSSRA